MIDAVGATTLAYMTEDLEMYHPARACVGVTVWDRARQRARRSGVDSVFTEMLGRDGYVRISRYELQAMEVSTAEDMRDNPQHFSLPSDVDEGVEAHGWYRCETCGDTFETWPVDAERTR